MKSNKAKTPTEYKFKFSIIMSVYMVEEFIEEAVESIINQTLDFKKNVQIIMVDDGSTDRSGEICDAYKEKYPENFVVVHQENGGLSIARNEGLTHAEGRYVNFFDPDDILTPTTLEDVYAFFSANDDYIDMVAIPLHYFDAKTGEHPTNAGKFNKGNRIIDLRSDYTLIHNSVASAFIKHDVAKTMHFDPNLCAMEDAKALISFLIFNQKYGVVSSCKYMYRQRTVGSVSLSHGAQRRKNWYTDFINRFSLSVVNYCLENVGYLPKFVQAVLLYDLHWKIEMSELPAGVMTPDEEEEFRKVFYSVFNYIDDDMLMSSKYYYFEHKALILSKKYPSALTAEPIPENILFAVRNTPLRYFSDISATKLEVLRIDNGALRIEANTFILPSITEKFERITPILLVNGETEVECRVVERDLSRTVLGEPVFRNLDFEAELKLDGLVAEDRGVTLELCLLIDGHRVKLNQLTYSDFCAVSGMYSNQYCAMDGYIIRMQKNALCIEKYAKKRHRELEKAFRRELWRSNKLGERKAVAARMLYSLIKPFKKKKILIISDRINKADDNGEAILAFLDSHPDYVKKNNLEYYYILDAKCDDYKRLNSKHVIPVYGFKHKLLHLMASAVLSSHSDIFVNKPMHQTYDCYRDLVVDQDFIFLQHGITQNDISGWLNRYNKNIRGFVTAAKPETRSILTYNYYYTESEVWELGFARFDRLYHDEKRYITLMPTWRKYLMTGSDARTGIWALGQEFKNSEYFKFYNGLINDPRLLAACDRLGYTLCFMPHPNIIPHIENFDKDPRVKFFSISDRYRDVYAQSDMVLTDYSSAAFDFAYLRKPIVYMHFDYDDFFKGDHVALPGYFNYRENGFGEVTATVEETVDTIISYMENGCKLKDVYRNRIDAFFVYNDRENCRRILDKTVEIIK